MPHSTDIARPLSGKRILVTRTREQASSFSQRLRELGAIPVEFPVIRIAPPLDWQPFDAALHRLCEAQTTPYDWLVFTSANGVEYAFARMQALGLSMPPHKGMRIAAIGPATAASLSRYGLRADLIPDDYIAEGVVAALTEDERRRATSLAGKRILIPRASVARDVLVTGLKEAGAIVQEVAAYRTLPVSSEDVQGLEIARMLRTGDLHILTFTSSSTVRNFRQWLINSAPDVAEKLRDGETGEALPVIACIGPITAQTARELGLYPQIEATIFTIDGLIEALVSYEGKK